MLPRMILLLGLILAACTSPPVDTSTPDLLPGATPYQYDSNPTIDALVMEYDAGMRDMLKRQGSTIEGKPYIAVTRQRVSAVVAFYESEMSRRGWQAIGSPASGSANNSLLAYSKGSAMFIVNVFDTTASGDPGVIIYAVKVTK